NQAVPESSCHIGATRRVPKTCTVMHEICLGLRAVRVRGSCITFASRSRSEAVCVRQEKSKLAKRTRVGAGGNAIAGVRFYTRSKRRDIKFRHRVGQTALRLGDVTVSDGWPARPHSEIARPQCHYRAAP